VDLLDMAIPFKEALTRLENSRVKSTRPLIPPQILQEDQPLFVMDPSEFLSFPDILFMVALFQQHKQSFKVASP
jgi:hypothetical protein